MDAITYVISAPYFWQTMVMTSACSMFLGPMLYNGDYKLLAKGLFTIIPYIALLLTTTIVRISNYPINNHYMAYAGLVTIIFLSFFYLSGMILGVLITRQAHKRVN